MTKVAVIGCGYVGLTTAVGLANESREVICIDSDFQKLNLISCGISPFYEPELEERLKELLNKKLITVSENDNQLSESDVIFICVPTPCRDDGSIDLSFIKTCAESTGRMIKTNGKYPVITIKSTVVPGTTEETVIPLLEHYSGRKVGEGFTASSNPEFLQEGKALRKFMNPDRIIIGEYDKHAGNVIESLYAEIKAPVIRTNIRTAEMIKYASNAFLASKISFINEIGNVCKKLGIDTYEVARGMGYDPRIGNAFLNAGLGFGGSCLPKDVSALVKKADSLGVNTCILKSVRDTNNRQTDLMITIVKDRLGTLKNKRITLLGLAFKPDTDDTRDSPAFRIISGLLAENARVTVFDPMVGHDSDFPFSDNVTIGNSAVAAIDESDAVIIITEWSEFRNIDLYKGKTVFDGRRALDPIKARQICRHYEGISW